MDLEHLKNTTNLDYVKSVAVMLFESNLLLVKENKELRDAQYEDKQERLKFEEKLSILYKKMFGAKSERSKPEVDRSVALPGMEKELLIYNQAPVPAPMEAEKPALAVEEVIHDLASVEPDSSDSEDKPTCPCCGAATLCEIKGQYEESSEITVTERTYTTLLHKRKKYTCKSCEKITTAPGPVKLQTKGEYSIDFAVQVAVDKYDYHIPLERQTRQMASAGLDIDTKTLYSQLAVLSDKFYAVAEAVKADVLSQPVVHADESPMKILSQNKQGYVWSISNTYGSYYTYDLSRRGEIAADLVKHFEGTLVTDGYTGYNAVVKAAKAKAAKAGEDAAALAKADGETDPVKLAAIASEAQTLTLVIAHCWAHARRKFHEAKEAFPKESEEILDLIKVLYKIDHEAKDFDALRKLRQEKSQSVIDDILEWLIDHKNQVLPSSSLGTAIDYTLKLWSGLTLFLKDPHIPLDNNTAERSLRTPVMGRKNFQGFRTLSGADVAMTFYTLIESSKRMRLNPHHYLSEMAHRACRSEPLLTPYRYALSIRKSPDAIAS